MNLQSFVVVLLRLVSLNFVLQMLYQFVPQLTRFFAAYRRFDQDESRSLVALPLLLVFGFAVGAVLLWVFARPIARLVTRGLSPEFSIGTLTLADGYSLLFIGIGLFYAVRHFSNVLNWAHYFLQVTASHQPFSGRSDVNWYEASDAIIPFIVGIIFFVNGRKWAVSLASKDEKSAASPGAVNQDQRTNL